MQREPAHVSRTSVKRSLEQWIELMRRVVDAWHERRYQHSRGDAGPVELRNGLQASTRIWRVRLCCTPCALVERRDRQARADRRALRNLEHQWQIAQQQR